MRGRGDADDARSSRTGDFVLTYCANGAGGLPVRLQAGGRAVSLNEGLEELGPRLRRARLAAPMTQDELAHISGVSVRAISDLECGRTRKPYPETVRLLTTALGMPVRADGDEPSAPVQGLAGGEGKLAAPAWQAPRQLPAAVASFTGRGPELAALTGILGLSAAEGTQAMATRP